MVAVETCAIRCKAFAMIRRGSRQPTGSSAAFHARILAPSEPRNSTSDSSLSAWPLAHVHPKNARVASPGGASQENRVSALPALTWPISANGRPDRSEKKVLPQTRMSDMPLPRIAAHPELDAQADPARRGADVQRLAVPLPASNFSLYA